jgi:hypothetical protein
LNAPIPSKLALVKAANTRRRTNLAESEAQAAELIAGMAASAKAGVPVARKRDDDEFDLKVENLEENGR